MNYQSDHFEFPVRQCGCLAAKLLSNDAIGKVSAIFDSSFYVELDNGLVCIGVKDLPLSPLNVIIAAPESTNWSASGLCLNSKVSIFSGFIRIGAQFSFRLAGAAEWKPKPVPATWENANLKQGLAVFREQCIGRIPHEGLGQILYYDTSSFDDQSLCKITEILIRELRDWLVPALRDPDSRSMHGLQWVHHLIGLGPGLTPSGDDFIGGMMIALHSLGELEICQQLWMPTRRCAIEAGNPIALAHLNAASEGLGSLGVHDALSAILEGCPHNIEKTLIVLDSIGHTSGWDAMAGVIVTFDAWLEAHRH